MMQVLLLFIRQALPYPLQAQSQIRMAVSGQNSPMEHMSVIEMETDSI
jgi:hypothetical protein